MYSFPPFPAPPDGVAIVPFSAFVPRGYRSELSPSGDPIEIDAWMGIKTIKVLNEEQATQKRKAKRRQRNAGNAVDATGRLIPWWEEWEEGEAVRGMSESCDGCVVRVYLLIRGRHGSIVRASRTACVLRRTILGLGGRGRRLRTASGTCGIRYVRRPLVESSINMSTVSTLHWIGIQHSRVQKGQEQTEGPGRRSKQWRGSIRRGRRRAKGKTDQSGRRAGSP